MAVYSGKGTVLYNTSSASTTYVQLGQIVSITPYSAESGSVETTDLDQSWRTHRHTAVSNGGTLNFTINYDPTSVTGERLKTLVTAPTTVLWKVIPSSPTTGHYPWFGGILTGFSPGALTVDGLHTADLAVQLTGTLTWAD